MNNGFKNEYDFIELFNNKKIYQLDSNSRNFINDIFDEINQEEIIKSWKNKMNQKADIFIKIGNYTKGISLKCGNNNSIHQEPIQEFKLFLKRIGIPYKAIDYYTSYQYGYYRENEKIDKNISLSSTEYKNYYQNELDIFNKYINKTKIIIELVDRFIIRGKNSDYDIDALIHGTPSDYVWIKKDDIYDLILSQRNNNYTSPHFGNITIGPKKRNIDGNSKYKQEKYIVCGRWNYIKEDIVNFKKNYNL